MNPAVRACGGEALCRWSPSYTAELGFRRGKPARDEDERRAAGMVGTVGYEALPVHDEGEEEP